MNFEEAVSMLKNAVKESHLVDQKHIDLSVIDASVRADYQKALMICQAYVAQGHITQEELKARLGLKA
jgi:hypothetical protein